VVREWQCIEFINANGKSNSLPQNKERSAVAHVTKRR